METPGVNPPICLTFFFRVDRLNVSIDTQTEMLENLVRMLAAKEKEAPHPSADIKL